MPYYNRDPKRDHKFDNHPCRAFPNEIPVRDSGSWASGDRIFWMTIGFELPTRFKVTYWTVRLHKPKVRMLGFRVLGLGFAIQVRQRNAISLNADWSVETGSWFSGMIKQDGVTPGSGPRNTLC